MQVTNPENRASNLEVEERHFGYSFLPGTLFVALLWLIRLLSYLTGASLVWLGVLPRNFFGFVGVFTGPLIHSDLLHLLSNSFPLVLLSGFILYMHGRVAVRVILLVYLLSGLLTWLIGRQAYHIGASGVVYGLAGYLLFNGFLRRNRGALAISFAVLFLYSGLFYGIFPNEEGISWEGHVAGLLAGFAAALVYGEASPEDSVAMLPPHETNVTSKHTSSTLGSNYFYMLVKYTVQPTKPRSTYHYFLNPLNGKADMPTHKHTSSSKRWYHLFK